MKPKLLVAIILIVLAVIFVAQNTEVVSVTFLVWTLQMSRIILIAGMFIIGCIVGFLLGKTKVI
ncbi:lipopolysaccharide assembly protein LapA domain-containing protein [Acidobacteriota bacterium]